MTEPTSPTYCAVQECDRLAFKRGLCSAHYQRARRMAAGPYVRPRGSLIERVMRKVDLEGEDGCWLYTGARDLHGYGKIGRGGRSAGTIAVHRATYLHFVGEIPEGYHIDHLCRVTSCVNPDHLEAVPPAENNRRSLSPSALNILKTHCIRGHELTGANLRVRKRRLTDGAVIARTCVACDIIRKRKWRARHNRASGVGGSGNTQ